ncbi:nucleotidyltransferase, partial [Salmonella enterica subsp. enterica serovar Enteritidis]|nr:nucleotidyltransferase [Salmonella enterica subsp. enterica serovar Enteritidis]
MSTATDFKTLLDNIKIDNAGQISKRYGRITKALNQYFYNLDSKTANSLQVGSYGRF